MTTTVTPVYGTPTAVTITLASLASNVNFLSGRKSLAVANTTDDADDIIIGGKVKLGTSPTGGFVFIRTFASYGGATYSDNLSSAESNSTLANLMLLRLVVAIPASTTTGQVYTWGPYSLCNLYGGSVPPGWGVFIQHTTGVNFDSTGGNHEVIYTPVTFASA